MSVTPFAEDDTPGVTFRNGSSRSLQPESIPQPDVRTESLPQGQPEPMDGEIIYENGEFGDSMDGEVIWEDGEMIDGDFDSFGGQRDPMTGERWNVCSIFSFLNESSVFVGPQSFKTGADGGTVGNFGFHVGANLSDAIWHRFGVGYQLGGAYNGSNFNGAVDPNTGLGTGSARRQGFITAGLYHRAFYGHGWQGGVVYDYLSDNFFINQELSQLRIELSWVFRSGREFGFTGATKTRQNAQAVAGVPVIFQPINMYNLYYRRNFYAGGSCRVWGGATGNRGGIIGGDTRLALSNRWDLTGDFNYIIPRTGGIAGTPNEAWAMTVNLVWYPGRCVRGNHNGPYRPLFGVADNSTFMVERAQ